jgi:HEAT repeat protein
MHRDTQRNAWMAAILLAAFLATGRPVAAGADEKGAPPGIAAKWTVPSAIDAMRGVHLAALTTDGKAALATRLDSAWEFLSGSGPEGRKALEDAVVAARAASPVDSFFLLDASRLLAGVTRDYAEQKKIAREALMVADFAASAEDAFYLSYLLAIDRKREDLPAIARILGLPDDATATVIPRSLDLDWRVQQLFVLGVFGTESLPVVRQSLRSADPLIRRGGAHVVGMLFDDASLPALRQLLRDPDARVVAEAARAVGSVGREEDVTALGALLAQSADGRVRFEAAFALYELTTPKAVPALIPGLQDARQDVRAECLSALLRYHDAAALAALVRQLPSEKDPEIRRAILQGLAREGTMPLAVEIEKLAADGRIAKTADLDACLREIRGRSALEPRTWEAAPPRTPAPDRMAAACEELAANSGRLTDQVSEILGRSAGPEDVPCLQEARSEALKRLSEAGLSDWSTLTAALKLARLRGEAAPKPS